MRTKYFLIILLFFSIGVTSDLSIAQVDYPTKPIQILIGYPAGGTTDILVRALTEEAKKYLGQNFIIINKPGAQGSVAVTHVVTGKSDGYTLGVSPSSTFTVNPFLQDLNVDFVKESTPILSFAKFAHGIVVKSDSPFKGLKDFLEYAKENPGKITFGLPGVGARGHLIMEGIAAGERVKLNFIFFQGDVPITSALLGGHVMAAVYTAGGWVAHVRGGTLRVLAVLEEERMDPFPEIPTIVEMGYPNPLPITVFLFGPRGLSESIVKKLAETFDKASQSPTFRKLAIDNLQYTKKNMFPEELAKFLYTEKEKTGDLIQRLGIRKK
jgi:tripartite-type tricarboxylate transporter receptor subunit TctC